MATPRLALDELVAQQSSAELTHNEALRALDVLVQSAVIDRDLTAPPGSPAAGDSYIVKATATGVWTGHEDEIAWFDGVVWKFQVPSKGWNVRVQDELTRVEFDGVSWNVVALAVTDHGGLTGLADDDHSQYARGAGRSGGQALVGSTVTAEKLTLSGSSGTDKGAVRIASAFELGLLVSLGFAADVNNWAIFENGVSRARITTLNGGDRNLTGIANRAVDRMIQVINLDATNTLTLVHNSGSSSAGNKLLLPGAANLVLGPNESAILIGGTSEWEIFAIAQVPGGAGGGAWEWVSTTVSGSPGNAVDVTGLDGTAEAWLIRFHFRFAAANIRADVRVRSGGTFQSTLYAFHSADPVDSSAAYVGQNSANSNSFQIPGRDQSFDASRPITGELMIFDPAATDHRKTMTLDMGHWDTSSTALRHVTAHGVWDGGDGAIDQIRFFAIPSPASDIATGATFHLYKRTAA